MKKFTLLLSFCFVCLAGSVNAGPYLVCDPQPDRITHYVVQVNDNATEKVEAAKVNSTHVRLQYDLSELSPGNFTIQVRSRIDPWGLESDAASYSSAKPESPPSCYNLQVIKSIKDGK